MHMPSPFTVASAVMAIAMFPVRAQEHILNLHSARHDQTDQMLHDRFTKLTGIKINRIEADELVTRTCHDLLRMRGEA